MKTTAFNPAPAFFNSTLPTTVIWGESCQPAPRSLTRVPQRFALDTDELAATKQEVVCGGVLALCFLYTLGHVFAQFAF